MTQQNLQRRYDIDWLRTLAFGLLILYHIGMYYVADWGWHIKSEQTSVLLQELMILTNQWRMSLLFFIAAIALALVQGKYSIGQLLSKRSQRLLIPLLFGMFVVVAPQPYIEALSQGLIEPGFIQFWLAYINPNTELLTEHHSPIGLLTWNHLWFIPYLFVYSAILIATRSLWSRLSASAWLSRIPTSLAVVAVILSMATIWFLLRQKYPVTHALLDDWYSHGKYFLTFVFGYLFAAQRQWWNRVIEFRHLFLGLAILGYAFIVADRHGAFTPLADLYQTSDWVRFFYGSIFSMNHWAWILCVVGYAGFWLNRPSKVLTYCNQAILPWYMLHQTLIIVFAWWLKPLQIDAAIEAPLLIVLTVVGCGLGYELIKRIGLLKPLFGLKRSNPVSRTIACNETAPA